MLLLSELVQLQSAEYAECK